MRKENYQFQGKIEGRRDIGRKKLSWLQNIRHWTELHDIQSLILTARNLKAMEMRS